MMYAHVHWTFTGTDHAVRCSGLLECLGMYATFWNVCNILAWLGMLCAGSAHFGNVLICSGLLECLGMYATLWNVCNILEWLGMLCARSVHFGNVLMSRSAGLCNSPPSRQAMHLDLPAAFSSALEG